MDIWRDPNSFPRFRNKSAQLTGKCVKCPFGEVCKAGCSAMAISQTGTLTETPFCIRLLEQEKIIKEMIGWCAKEAQWCAKQSSAELTE